MINPFEYGVVRGLLDEGESLLDLRITVRKQPGEITVRGCSLESDTGKVLELSRKISDAESQSYAGAVGLVETAVRDISTSLLRGGGE